MFTAALFTVAKIQKRPKCPLTDEWIKINVVYIYNGIFVVQTISHVQLFVTTQTQHFRVPCPSLSPGLCSSSCPLSWWCHPTISSSVAPFSSCLLSFPASRCFSVSRLLASGGQSIETSLASASALAMSIRGWFPLGSTGLISLFPTPQFEGINSSELSLFVLSSSLNNEYLVFWVMDYYSDIKKAMAWVDLEGITLSETS